MHRQWLYRAVVAALVLLMPIASQHDHINNEALLETSPSVTGLPNENKPRGSQREVFCTRDKGYRYLHPERVLPESPLAHFLLDNLCGIEIGTASSNPYGLNTIQVGLTENMDPVDFKYYRDGQIKTTGDYAKIDVGGDALNLSAFYNSSVDFVLASHVWEHVPNPLQAIEEWVRVTKDGGLLFLVVPHRCAKATDCNRPLTTFTQLLHYYETQATVDYFPDADMHRGHYIIFSPSLLMKVLFWFNQKHAANHHTLSLKYFLEVDDKIGNGHMIVFGVHKHPVNAEEIMM